MKIKQITGFLFILLIAGGLFSLFAQAAPKETHITDEGWDLHKLYNSIEFFRFNPNKTLPNWQFTTIVYKYDGLYHLDFVPKTPSLRDSGNNYYVVIVYIGYAWSEKEVENKKIHFEGAVKVEIGFEDFDKAFIFFKKMLNYSKLNKRVQFTANKASRSLIVVYGHLPQRHKVDFVFHID